MRINDRNPVLGVETQRAYGLRGGPRADKAGGPDKVSLSDEVRRLREAKAERLEQLRAQITEGDYSLDLDVIAEAIVTKEGLA